MLKRIFLGILLLFTSYVPAHSAEIVNVEYVHSLIKKVWNIDVPYYEDSLKYAANMEYLLKAVDKANEILNGTPTTDYGNSEYATLYAADTVATIDAVNRLIEKQNKSSFFITTTPDTSSFSFNISAAGEYTIDWGDGKTETITKSDTTNTTYSHTYDSAGEYTIGIGGKATAYSSSITTTAVSFRSNKNISEISGSLGKIFSTLSDGSQPSFFSTFSGCSGLTGEIPADLFAGVQGSPTRVMMFQSTFQGCSGLTGSIPENLFAGIHGAPASSMFYGTFTGCSGLTGEIPAGLFAGIQGAPVSGMFYGTFSGCTGLTGIPADLFAGIRGAPATYMFYQTFYECTGLTGEIPADLFAGIQGAPANYMFYGTFDRCSGLTGSIPADLFAGIKGAPASYMFSNTFSGCSNLSGEIPLGLFGTFTSKTPKINMFYNTFNGCSGLTGPSARMPDGTYLYNYFNTATIRHVGGMYTGATGLEDYPCIPTAWGGAGGVCATKSSFYITTTPTTSSFDIMISAAGEYTIDWGDGKTETITKNDTTMTPYSHTYASAGEYTIGIGGKATAYSSSTSTAAVSFSYNENIAEISGSLGKVFSTLSDGTQPRFYSTFEGCSGLTGSIPADLFSGIQGAPADWMFAYTFAGCSGLTGEIPADLFAGITGAPAEYMFNYTFNGCRGLTGSVPADLFAGISGAPAESMFSGTFSGCSGLTSIPADLFAGIQGAPASYMFEYTFAGCSGLTGEIPLGLFGTFTSNTPQSDMFRNTFNRCSKLTGPSARQPDGTYLYDYFNTATTSHVDNMYTGATGLSDYSSIPAAWK